MVTKHKIHIDYYDNDFSLLAIHSSLDDHAMVYALNHNLQLRLVRERNDLNLGEGIEFPVFGWEDEFNDIFWSLLSNTCQVEEKMTGLDLFQNETSPTQYHLIPERKEVDFFLKIESDDTDLLDEALERLARIPQVITSYAIEPKELKSIENIMY